MSDYVLGTVLGPGDTKMMSWETKCPVILKLGYGDTVVGSTQKTWGNVVLLLDYQLFIELK